MTQSPQRIPRSPAEQLSAARMAAPTGADLVRGMATGRLPAAPMAELANVRLAELAAE